MFETNQLNIIWFNSPFFDRTGFIILGQFATEPNKQWAELALWLGGNAGAANLTDYCELLVGVSHE